MLRQLTREPVLAAGISLAIVPPALLHFLSSEKVAWGGVAHALFVGASAGGATIAAIVLTVAAARRNDGRSVMIGSAFAVMAALLVLHGIATPGVLFDDYGVVAFSGAATIPAGGVLLALCTLPILRHPRAVKPLLVMLGVLLAAVATLGFVGLAFPNTVPGVPEPRSTAAWIALGVGLGFYALVGWRAFRTYRLTRRAADLLVVVGTAWLACALAASLLLTYLDLGWWLGHGLEVLGIAAIGVPVALDLRRAVASRPLLGDLSACRARRRGGSVPRRPGQRADATARRTRRLHRGAHAPSRAARRAGRRRAPAAARAPARARRRRSPARHGQALRSRRDPEQARCAHGRGVRDRQAPLGVGRRASRTARVPRRRAQARPRPPRAARRLRLPVRRLRRPARPRDTDPRHLRRVRRADLTARLPRAWSHERALSLLREEAGRQFDERCVAALERVLRREQPELAVAV